jgi:hypothetical protein
MPFPALYTLLHRADSIATTPADWRDALDPLIDRLDSNRVP